MRITAALLLLFLALGAAAASLAGRRAWQALPLANTSRQHFDLILVLGAPCRRSGEPSPEQRERALTGVRAWQGGAAPRLLLSGGPAHNRWVEADSMARIARSAGVAPGAVLEDRTARNTVENVAGAYALMQAHGWRSVLVVSSASHLPRAGLILARFPIQWRTEAAPWPPEEWRMIRHFHEWLEAEYCLRLRWFGFPRSQASDLPRSANPPLLPSALPSR